MIYGDRLRLRAVEREDLPVFVVWFNDPEVRRFLSLNLPISSQDEARWFDTMQTRPPTEHPLGIEIREGEGWKLIGNMSLMDVDWINRSAEVGIVIGEKPYWNQGYGREALCMMLRHAFETLNLNRVFLRVFEHNVRGIKAYEHAGFQHEGRMRQAVFQEGRYYDILIMSVLRSEWEQKG